MKKSRILVALFSILVLFSMLDNASGITNGKPPCYSGVVNIPAASLTPRLNTYNINNVGGYVNSSSSGHVNFYAPLALPDGARITKIVMDAFDNSTTGYIDVDLRQSRYAAGSILVTIDTTAAAHQGDVTITKENLDITIDNTSYTYYFDVHFWNVDTTSNRFYRLLVYFSLFDCPRSVVVIPLL